MTPAKITAITTIHSCDPATGPNTSNSKVFDGSKLIMVLDDIFQVHNFTCAPPFGTHAPKVIVSTCSSKVFIGGKNLALADTAKILGAVTGGCGATIVPQPSKINVGS